MCIKNNKAPRYRKISGALLSKNIFGGQGMKYIDACMYVCMYVCMKRTLTMKLKGEI